MPRTFLLPGTAVLLTEVADCARARAPCTARARSRARVPVPRPAESYLPVSRYSATTLLIVLASRRRGPRQAPVHAGHAPRGAVLVGVRLGRSALHACLGVADQCMELGLNEALLTLCIATALFYLVCAMFHTPALSLLSRNTVDFDHALCILVVAQCVLYPTFACVEVFMRFNWSEQVRALFSDSAVEATGASTQLRTMSDSAVVGVAKLGFPWQTSDPFLFCVYHDDLFPPGDEDLGPAIPQHLLWRGRNRGADFGGKWNMYHGEKVCKRLLRSMRRALLVRW